MSALLIHFPPFVEEKSALAPSAHCQPVKYETRAKEEWDQGQQEEVHPICHRCCGAPVAVHRRCAIMFAGREKFQTKNEILEKQIRGFAAQDHRQP